LVLQERFVQFINMTTNDWKEEPWHLDCFSSWLVAYFKWGTRNRKTLDFYSTHSHRSEVVGTSLFTGAKGIVERCAEERKLCKEVSQSRPEVHCIFWCLQEEWVASNVEYIGPFRHFQVMICLPRISDDMLIWVLVRYCCSEYQHCLCSGPSIYYLSLHHESCIELHRGDHLYWTSALLMASISGSGVARGRQVGASDPGRQGSGAPKLDLKLINY